MRDRTPHTIEVVTPFPDEDYPRVHAWIEAVPSLILPGHQQTIDGFIDDWLGDGDRAGRAALALTFAIYRDGVLGGWVVFEPNIGEPGTGSAHCVFKKGASKRESFFGWATTLPALTEIARDLFAVGITRIDMAVMQANQGMVSLLRKLGARQVGTFQSAGDEPLTVLHYALYKDDWDGEHGRGDEELVAEGVA